MRHLIVITTLLILCSKKAACIVDDVLHVVTEKIILFEWLNLRTTQASYIYLIFTIKKGVVSPSFLRVTLY